LQPTPTTAMSDSGGASTLARALHPSGRESGKEALPLSSKTGTVKKEGNDALLLLSLFDGETPVVAPVSTPVLLRHPLSTHPPPPPVQNTHTTSGYPCNGRFLGAFSILGFREVGLWLVGGAWSSWMLQNVWWDSKGEGDGTSSGRATLLNFSPLSSFLTFDLTTFPLSPLSTVHHPLAGWR
jgi:hypothetical protein